MSKPANFNDKLRSEIAPFVKKGMQLRKPREVKFSLSPETADILEALCDLPEFRCGVVILVRGIIEDFCDKYKGFLPDEEVSGE